MAGKDRYVVVPLTLAAANAFVARYHRHNKPVTGYKFSIGLTLDGNLIGVGIAGRPVARHLDDGMTAQRQLVLCTGDNYSCAI